MRLDKFRPGQLRAFDVCMTRLARAETHTTIVLPTRYGKSDLMRCVAYAATSDRVISGAIGLSPFQLLTEQLVNKDRVTAMVLRYGLDYERAQNIRQLKSFTEIDPFSNHEYFLAANMQLGMRDNTSTFRALADHEHHKTSLPMALFIDECHFIGQHKRWGEFLSVAVDAGCLLVLLTATPIRDDGDQIPGFERETLSRTEAAKYFWWDAGDGKNNLIEEWRGAREVVKLKAHHITTFKEAWDEKPSPLCHLSREVIDIDVVNAAGESTRLSALSVSKGREVLTAVTRDPQFLELAVWKFLEVLREVQAINPRCAGIVLTGNDQSVSDSRDNEHAEAVKALIRQCGEEYLGHAPSVTIVTMKTTEDDRPVDKLNKFVGDDAHDGRGDVLIVKRMGVAGLDAARLKVMLDVSVTRTVAATVQGWMRVGTPYEGLAIGHVIMPADPLGSEIWQRFIVAEGGQIDEAAEWVPEECVDAYLKPKPDDTREAATTIGDSEFASYDDSHGNVGDMGSYDAVSRLIIALPDLAKLYTKAQIAAGLTPIIQPHQTDQVAPAFVRHRPLDAKIDELRGVINKTADDIIRTRYRDRGTVYTGEQWASDRRELFTRMYRTCHILKGTKLSQIVNVDTLQKLRAFLDAESGNLFV